ncbi:MAG: dockerin type I repeat-containing protein, partial [Clostridia bacterium]|nr:dockerin type I repeat-containing protein [Clostridia bacterium]
HAEVNGSYVEVLDDQFETHWLPGENWLTISYLGETASIPVYIVENPVESIEVVTPQSLTFTEYQGGEWESEPVGIEETYDFYRYHIVPDDFEIVIHYTDSAREDLVVRPHDEIDGYTVRAGDNQVYQPFHVGDDNEFIIEYMGHTASIPLNLLPSSVIKGDLNGDDVVDIRDLIRLKKFIASNKKMDVTGNPDLNDDNTINSLDLIALKRQILFS